MTEWLILALVVPAVVVPVVLLIGFAGCDIVYGLERPPFETTFAWTAEEEARSRDGPGWQGACLVQRIEAGRLSAGGGQVRLTVRASSMGIALIDRIYISRPNPAPGSDPYASDAADLTPYTTTIEVVERDRSKTLPPINYNLDEGQPLLIVVDFNTASPSAVRAIDGAPPQETSTYYKLGAQEAANSDRANFLSSTVAIFFIEKIEAI